MSTTFKKQVCLLDSSRGIYIPQAFAECFNMQDWGVSAEDAKILLAGPDQEFYWETWDQILMEASIIIDGQTWRLAQDGDLFAVMS